MKRQKIWSNAMYFYKWLVCALVERQGHTGSTSSICMTVIFLTNSIVIIIAAWEKKSSALIIDTTFHYCSRKRLITGWTMMGLLVCAGITCICFTFGRGRYAATFVMEQKSDRDISSYWDWQYYTLDGNICSSKKDLVIFQTSATVNAILAVLVPCDL